MYELHSVVVLNSTTFLEKMGDRTLREETFVTRNFCEDKVNREILLRNGRSNFKRRNICDKKLLRG